MISQIITLGIGDPSGITEFLTFGLQINPWKQIPLAVTIWTDLPGF